MSASGPSKYCPRCETALPLSAPYCDVCGYQFMPYSDPTPQSTNYGYGSNYGPPPQYIGQMASERWPLSRPSYPPPGGPGYPQQWPPGYGYPYAPDAAPPRGSVVGKLVALVLVLVVLVGGGAAAWFLYLSPSHSNSPLFDRHGLPSNVPLPNNLTFVTNTSYSATNSRTNVTATLDEWGWKAAGINAAAIAQFYRDQMAGQGWTSIRSQTAQNGDQEVIGCQGVEILLIGANDNHLQLSDNQGNPGPIVTAPSGGSALGIILISTNDLQAATRACTESF